MQTAQRTRTETVGQIYASFLQGDVPGILQHLDSSVMFVHPGNPEVLPFAGEYLGKDEAARFFQTVGMRLTFEQFEPGPLSESGSRVRNRVDMTAVVSSNQARFQAHADFIWTFNAAGKVIHWTQEGDFGPMEAAFQR